MKRMKIHGLSAGLVLAASPLVAASDFGLDYDVERVAAAKLSLAGCAAAVERGSNKAGYATRTKQDKGKLILHVSGPEGDGRALVSYCIQAGTQTVWIVQTLDYAGSGKAASPHVVKTVVAELRRAAGLAGRK